MDLFLKQYRTVEQMCSDAQYKYYFKGLNNYFTFFSYPMQVTDTKTYIMCKADKRTKTSSSSLVSN